MSIWGGGYVQAAVSAYEAREQDKLDEQRFQQLFDAQYGTGPESRMGIFNSPRIANSLLEDLFTGSNGASVVDFMTRRLPLSKGEKSHRRFFNREAAPMVRQGISDLESLKPYADELVRTGMPTDLEGIWARNEHMLRNETIPSLYESRFASLGEGSGLNSLVNNAARDFQIERGALEFARDESATNRRVAGIPLAANTYRAPSEFATAGFGTIGRESELGRIRAESVRPGALPPVPSTLSLFPGLASVEQGQVFPVMPNSYGGTGSGQWGTALAAAGGDLLGRLGGAAVDYFGNSGGGPYGGGDMWGSSSIDYGGTGGDFYGNIYNSPVYSTDYGSSFGSSSMYGGSDWSATGDYSLTGIEGT
jgi:hypothetical protein